MIFVFHKKYYSNKIQRYALGEDLTLKNITLGMCVPIYIMYIKVLLLMTSPVKTSSDRVCFQNNKSVPVLIVSFISHHVLAFET